MNCGISLETYVDGRIHYGIKTGRNSVFIIDENTRDRLIEQDSSSAKIIKPFLMGRDINRYRKPDAVRYVIFTRRGIEIERLSRNKSIS